MPTLMKEQSGYYHEVVNWIFILNTTDQRIWGEQIILQNVGGFHEITWRLRGQEQASRGSISQFILKTAIWKCINLLSASIRQPLLQFPINSADFRLAIPQKSVIQFPKNHTTMTIFLLPSPPFLHPFSFSPPPPPPSSFSSFYTPYWVCFLGNPIW